MQPAPIGTVTFLFTDIEGSTRLWEERPEAMSGNLERHDDLLRDTIEANGGYLVKATGDGFHAAFADARAAVSAAIAAQRIVTETTSLQVRMGLHTGVADFRDGDYFGPTLNRAARLMGIGHAGQILLSQSTASLVGDIGLRDLGEHRLRDLSRPEHTYQVLGEGLRADFPPLRSLDAFAGNLPLQLTSFVGRERELNALATSLAESRMVTIVGVGGVGKTRIALHVAADLVSEFHDGAWVCELANATDAESVAQVVGGALGVTLQPGVTMEACIVEFLRTKRALLVFDNCEHVLDAAGHLAESVLRACADVRVLATSREPLALDGERITALRSLSVADPSGPTDAFSASEAVQLFEDRARAARSGFVIDASNAAAVDEICRRLDGIPLAIELAAVRVVAMSPSEIAALLDERFRLLTGGRRGTLERHQTLRATVEWSYGLLAPTERVVFNRLAVFSSLTPDAARAVATDDDVDGWAVIDALEGLVRKSMLNAEEQADGSTRYQMLETLRQYALEQLDEVDTWRRRHAEYFGEFAEAIAPELLGAQEMAARSRLDADLDNLRTATIWALDRDDTEANELAVRILAALAEDYGYSSRTRWALPAAERAIDSARRSTPGRRAAVLAMAAQELTDRFEDETAYALGDEAYGDGITPDCPSPHMVCLAIGGFGGAAPLRAEIIPVLESIVAQLEATDILPAELARVTLTLVRSYVMTHDSESARRWAERANELARRSGNPSTICNAAYHMGTLWARDEPARAIAAYQQAIDMGVLGAGDVTTGAALFQCALLLARVGQRQVAVTYLREAIDRCEQQGNAPVLDGALAYAIEILTVLGEYEDAAVIAGSARSGALARVKQQAVPPERSQRSASPLREALGDRFDEHASRGAAMSYDELVVWTRATLTRLLEEA